MLNLKRLQISIYDLLLTYLKLAHQVQFELFLPKIQTWIAAVWMIFQFLCIKKTFLTLKMCNLKNSVVFTLITKVFCVPYWPPDHQERKYHGHESWPWERSHWFCAVDRMNSPLFKKIYSTKFHERKWNKILIA